MGIDFIDKLSIEELERHSTELQAKREKAKAELHRAQKYYSTVTQEKDIVDQILEFKKSRLKESTEMSSTSKAINEVDKTTAKAINEVDKTATILEAVRRGGARGVLPKELEAGLRESGVELKDGYVHAILSRLKKRGEVITQGKRYLSTESKTVNGNL